MRSSGINQNTVWTRVFRKDGCVNLEEPMKRQLEVTDLQHDRLGRIEVLEPYAASGRGNQLERLLHLPVMYENLQALKFIHLGSLETEYCRPTNLSRSAHVCRELSACGGILCFRQTDKHATSAQCIKCKTSFVLAMDHDRFARGVLDLAVKQMVPGLPSLNYYDTSVSYVDSEDEEGVDAVRSYGTLAVFAFALRCGEQELKAHMGFTVRKGLRTQSGCDGMDDWLQYLLVQHHRRLKLACEAIKLVALGLPSD